MRGRGVEGALPEMERSRSGEGATWGLGGFAGVDESWSAVYLGVYPR